MRVNFLSAADLCRCAIRDSWRRGSGRIVNMASRAGQRGHSADALAYGASKTALTKSIAQSFGTEGITVFALTPGWVHTEMAEAFAARHGEAATVELEPGASATSPALLCLWISPGSDLLRVVGTGPLDRSELHVAGSPGAEFAAVVRKRHGPSARAQVLEGRQDAGLCLSAKVRRVGELASKAGRRCKIPRPFQLAVNRVLKHSAS